MGASIVLLAGVCRRLCLSSVVVCNTPRRRNVTHQGAARDGGPVVLRPVTATSCFIYFIFILHCAYNKDRLINNTRCLGPT